ncbi:MAG TPA: hypothetical protein VJ964_05315, partial [Balneolaceae bacterium]|nr:hypothetical protein [Balneolaceae bacterium]
MNKDESNSTLIGRFISIVRQSFRQLRRKHAIALVGITLTILLSGLLITGVMEHLFYLSATAKITALLLLIILTAGLVIYYRHAIHEPTFTEFYHQFGKRNANPQLSDALDLYFASNPQKPALHEAAIR